MSSLSLMIHRATIRRSTPVRATTGHVSPAYADLATDVPCLEQQSAGRSRLGAAGAYLEYDAIVFLPPNQDVRPRGPHDLPDQLVVNGTTYLVRWVGDESGMGDHLTALCARLPAGG